jgi:hypothetical protein
MELFAGMIESRMVIQTASNYAENFKPYGGINLRFTPDRRLHRFSFSIGMNYSFNDFNKTYDNVQLFGQERSYQVHSKYSVLRLPILIEYSFFSGKLRPTLSIGYTNVFIPKPQYSSIGEYVINPSTIHYQHMPSDFRNYQFGICAGAGIRYSLRWQNYVYFKCNYEYRIPGAKMGDFFDYQHVNSLLIDAGYGFNLGR